jgi:hypothetical protein
MLSAICLINYFEGGQLPKDRVLLYKLCVEGLLHHWDQRRGIRSEFALSENLRVCREVAMAMQSDDRAEYEAEKVQAIITATLDDPYRAKQLLEHIRYRTGLLLERRPGIFAFAHLTFQEYLAAQAVHEGNQRRTNIDRLIGEHSDGRWHEVIALYCAIAPTSGARNTIARLMAQPNTGSLATVLAEAYQAAGLELSQDRPFRLRILERIAISPAQPLRQWRTMNSWQVFELVFLLHRDAPDTVLIEMASDSDLYAAPAPPMLGTSQAGAVILGLSLRKFDNAVSSEGVDITLLQALRVLSKNGNLNEQFGFFSIHVATLMKKRLQAPLPRDVSSWSEFVLLSHMLGMQLANMRRQNSDGEQAIAALNSWADLLQSAIDARAKQ